MSEMKKNFENSQVIEFLKNLDSRVSRIEARLNIEVPHTENDSKNEENTAENYEGTNNFESKLGEYWFANFGILILAISVAILLTTPFESIPASIPSLVGFSLVGLILYFSHKLKDSYHYISNYLVGTGYVLFYFSTLRLFHFTESPVLSDKVIESILLLLIVAICFFISERRKSPYLTSLSLTLACATGIIIGFDYLIFSLLVIISGIFVILHIKNDWKYILLFGMGIVYFTHFVWAINNPFLGNPLQILAEPKFNLIFIAIYSTIFALGNLLNKNALEENNITISNSMINGLGSFILFQIICLSNFDSDIIFYELIYFAVFFSIAILFWVRTKSKYSTSTYSLMAFISLSAAVIALTEVPDVFIFLIWQCILVTAAAIWFQSKTLTVTNFLIFLGLFFVYLITAGGFSIISLSFGIVALISARILNWQKQRLTLKTEFMRNIYLAIAFFSIPFTLAKSLPNEYIGLSWLVVSVLYYILSIVLKTFKYRWMAHLTLIGTIFYVLIFGLSSLDTTFKIITLFSIGIVTFIISILFTRHKVGRNNLKSEITQ